MDTAYQQTPFPIIIDQGATFNLPIYIKDEQKNPINIHGYSARMQIRKTVYSNDQSEPLIDLTTENGGIHIDGANGIVGVIIPANITADFPAEWTGEYDIFITSPDGSIVDKLLGGTVYIAPRVTR